MRTSQSRTVEGNENSTMSSQVSCPNAKEKISHKQVYENLLAGKWLMAEASSNRKFTTAMATANRENVFKISDRDRDATSTYYFESTFWSRSFIIFAEALGMLRNVLEGNKQLVWKSVNFAYTFFQFKLEFQFHVKHNYILAQK